MPVEHRLEKRARALAGALTHRVELVRNVIAPKGQRPPFTVQLTGRKALEFWRRHRYDDVGAQILGFMAPDDILELDQALSQQIETEELGYADS